MIENEFNLPSIPEILEEKEYKHRTKYRSLYIRLIKRGLSMTEKELNGYNEKHHILPRCMGGDDNKENLVLLPVRYHIMAHIILLEVYPENNKIAITVGLMLNGSNSNGPMNIRTSIIEKKFSSRLIAKSREKAKKLISGSNSPILGGKNPNSKRVISPEGKIFNSIKEASKYYKIPYMTITKWLSGESSDHGWSYYNCSKTDYTKIKRITTLSSKSIKDINGNIYSSIKDASVKTNTPYTTLRYWLSGRTKDNHGWTYV